METNEELKKEIDSMTQVEMAYLWRYSPIGSPYFKGDIGDYFKKRFDSLGGFTPAISKGIDRIAEGG